MRLEAAVENRLIHGDVIPGGAAAMEAHGAAIEDFLGLQRRRARHLTAEAELGVGVAARDAGAPGLQARKHFLGIIADR